METISYHKHQEVILKWKRSIKRLFLQTLFSHYFLRNAQFKKYTDERQNTKWKRWKTTVCRPKLDGLMSKLSDKVCQFYSDDVSQVRYW